MSTAAEHRIIIEKGADYKINVIITIEDGVTPKNVTGYAVYMRIKYDNAGVINYLVSNGSLQVTDNVIATGTVIDGPNGEIEIVIDKAVTALLPTQNSAEVGAFSTEYNYYYTIDINGGTSDDIRILRGRLAIRE